ncbi:MAG: hypothetical protein NT051_03460 [Candidatus Micrarchaeota archaeon]|nr:hypothetical protein [Candidatus Micrarchaeota archaeon]
MEDRTIIISSRELVDHTVLVRRRNELEFKRDFLLRTGAKPGDLHLKAIDDELFIVGEKLHPIDEKLSVVDMITLVPNRKEIGEYTERINNFSREQLDSAVRSKSGEAYELMKKRAVLVKNNYERKEDIARLTILLNTAPRKEAEAIRALVEEGQGEDADVSFFQKETRQELVNLASRIGRQCCVIAGSLSMDKKKVDSAELKPADEVMRLIAGNKRVWIEAGRLAEFEENEKSLTVLLGKLQAKNAEKQTRELTEEETVYIDKIQNDYIAAKQKRSELARGLELSETAKLYRKPPKSEDDGLGDGY